MGRMRHPRKKELFSDEGVIDFPPEKALNIQAIERIFKRSFSVATKVQLLLKGKESFQALFSAVEEAEQSICLQFYIYRDDETGLALAELLKQRSRKGVNVYILYDHFGSVGTPRRFWKDLKMAGVHIRASHPFRWTAPLTYIHRDHRKLIVIDSKRAFTGGLNIANEYSGFHLRRRGRVWRDTGIMLEGPIVYELLETFRRSWSTWGGGQMSVSKPEPECSTRPSSRNIPALPIFVYSGRGRKRMRRLLAYSVIHAQETISLTTPYFIPSRKMVQLLENAVRRGVRVRLLVPGRSDVPAAAYAGRAFFMRLLNAGVEIYTYRGEMLHAKTYLFDPGWSIIGSTNIDYQSLWYNDEGNVGIFDIGFGAEMARIFEEDLSHSHRLERTIWRNRPFVEKAKEHFFALFRKRL